MKFQRRLPILLLVALVTLSNCKPSFATTDSARVESVYFHMMADTSTEHVTAFYTKRWRSWLQLHRAIEKSPNLRRQLLKLPFDPVEGRKGGANLILQQLSSKTIAAQPSHVFILQLGVYRNTASLSLFMKQKWPKVSKPAIYFTTPKSFRVDFSSESPAKSQPLFVTVDKRLVRLNYGIYASVEDASLDAKAFSKILGYQPTIQKQTFTPQLTHSVIFDTVAGQLP